MEEEAGVKPDRLYNVLAAGDAEDKLTAVSQLKREVKKQMINLRYALGYFEALEVAVGSSDQTLSATGFSCLCSLIKRITLQDASVLKDAAHIALPIIVEKLGDDKPAVRTSARKTFDGFWMACPEESEETLRERALVHPNATVRYESLQMLLSRVQLQTAKFSFRPFTPLVAQLLLDNDDRVQAVATDLLELFFRSAPQGAKVDLQRTMHRQGVPKPLMSKILKAIGFASASVMGRPSEEGPRSAPVMTSKDKEAPVKSALSTSFVTSQDAYGMEDLRPADISSGMEIRSIVEASEAAFANPTEHNWGERERSYKRLRALIRGNAATDYVEELQWILKELAGGIAKDIISLRTTLACQSCQLIRECALVLGPQLDTLEPCLTSIVKIAKGTKKITFQLGSLTVGTIIINCAYTQRYLYHIQDVLRDKAPQPKVFAIQWLRLVIACHHRKQVLDASIGIISALIGTALGDAHPSVREGARNAFWAMHAVWPKEADALLHSTDSMIQKGLESSRPDGSARSAAVSAAAPRAKSRTGVRPPSRTRGGISSAPVQSTASTSSTASNGGGLKREIGKPVRLGAPQRQPIRRPNNISAPRASNTAAAPPTPTASTLMELLTSSMESERYARGIKILSLLLTRSDIPSTIEVAHPVTMPRPDSISMILRKLFNSERGVVSDVVNQLSKEDLLPKLLQFVDTPLLISGLVRHVYPSSELSYALKPLSSSVSKEEAFETAATLFDSGKLDSDNVKLALLAWLTSLASGIEHPNRVKNCLTSFAQCLDGDIEGDVYMQTLVLMQELSAYYELGPIIEEIISKYDSAKPDEPEGVPNEYMKTELIKEPVDSELLEHPKTPESVAMDEDVKTPEPANVERVKTPELVETAQNIESSELTVMEEDVKTPEPAESQPEVTTPVSTAKDISTPAPFAEVSNPINPAESGDPKTPSSHGHVMESIVVEHTNPADVALPPPNPTEDEFPEERSEQEKAKLQDDVMDDSAVEQADPPKPEDLSAEDSEEVPQEDTPMEVAAVDTPLEELDTKEVSEEDGEDASESDGDQVMSPEPEDAVLPNEAALMGTVIEETLPSKGTPDKFEWSEKFDGDEDSQEPSETGNGTAEINMEADAKEEEPVQQTASPVMDEPVNNPDTSMEEPHPVQDATVEAEETSEPKKSLLPLQEVNLNAEKDDPTRDDVHEDTTPEDVGKANGVANNANDNDEQSDDNDDNDENTEGNSFANGKATDLVADKVGVTDVSKEQAADMMEEDTNEEVVGNMEDAKEATDGANEIVNIMTDNVESVDAMEEDKADVEAMDTAEDSVIGLGVDPPRTPARATIKDLHEQIESKLSIYEDKVRSIPHSPTMQASTPLATPTKRMAMRSVTASPGSPSLSWYSFESKKQYCMSPLPTRQDEASALFEALISQLDDGTIDTHGFRKLITIVRRAKDRKSNEVACELWRQERWQARLQVSLLNYLQQGGSISESQLHQGLLQLKQLLYLHNDTFLGHERGVFASLVTVAGATTNKTVIHGALSETQDEIVRLSKHDCTSRQRVIESALELSTHYPALNREQKSLCVSTLSKVLNHVVSPSEVETYLHPIMQLVLQSIGDAETYVRKESYPVLVALRRVLDADAFAAHVTDKLSTGQRHLMEYYWSKRA